MSTEMASPTYAPPSDSMQVFIVAVKAKLDQMQISQGELARRSGMLPGDVSKMLSGKQGNCTLARCDKIASALGTTTIELLSHH